MSDKISVEPHQIETPSLFHWQAYPAKQRVKASIIGGIIIIILGIIILISFQSLILALLAIFVLVLRLNRFYFPSSFSIDNNGVTAKYLLRTQQMEWSKIKRFETDNYGAYISERSVPSRWDAFGGMHILFGNERAKVISLIKTGMKAV